MKLIKLELKNFKGLQDFRLHLDGDSAVVTGDNGTGKTTLLDAYLWTMHGHDSEGNKNPDVRPATDCPYETTVRVRVEDTTGKTLTFYRSVLPNGATEYRINETYMKATQYWQALGSMYVEPYLSTPWAFHALHWKERRSILEDVAGMESLGRLEAFHKKYSRSRKEYKWYVDGYKLAEKLIKDFNLWKLSPDYEKIIQSQRKTLAFAIERAEKRLYKIEQAIIKMGTLLTRNVSLESFEFQTVKANKDGDRKPTCDTWYRGVPWHQLNHAKQIEAGIALIDRLFEHYKIRQPVFVDNAEAIVMPESPGDMQVVWLKAAPGELRKKEVCQ